MAAVSLRDAAIARYNITVRPTPITHAAIEKWSAANNIKRIGILCGSYRRNATKSNDIDLLVPITSMDAVCRDLKIKLYTSGNTMRSGFVKLGRTYCQIDLLGYTAENRICMILHFTGSREFNIRMRAIAKNKGYLLNQDGLFNKKGQRVRIRDERDIFVKLAMEYVRADERK